MTEQQAAGARQTSGRRRRVGQLGEDLAAAFVESLGWSVLERNWRNRYGELDLIAADGDVLVVVEVKSRASRVYADPFAAVTPEKLGRMRTLTRYWLSAQDQRWARIRFDVISVQLDPAAPDDPEGARLRHHLGVTG